MTLVAEVAYAPVGVRCDECDDPAEDLKASAVSPFVASPLRVPVIPVRGWRRAVDGCGRRSTASRSCRPRLPGGCGGLSLPSNPVRRVVPPTPVIRPRPGADCGRSHVWGGHGAGRPPDVTTRRGGLPVRLPRRGVRMAALPLPVRGGGDRHPWAIRAPSKPSRYRGRERRWLARNPVARRPSCPGRRPQLDDHAVLIPHVRRASERTTAGPVEHRSGAGPAV